MAENPRFPHYCQIYRKLGVTSFRPDGEIVQIYSGVCKKSSSTNIRTFNTGSNTDGKVDVVDYRISMPGIVKGIKKGDLVDVTDLMDSEIELRVVMVENTTLGEYSKKDENGKVEIVKGGTALLCNVSSN